MTGYCFCKILKAKEVDDFYHKKKLNKGRNKKEEKGGKASDLKQIEHNPIDFNFQFAQMTLNKVMLNQFDNCACFHLDPERPDQAALKLSEKQSEIIWLKFGDHYNVKDLSAETIASMFSNFGDFHVFKDTL